MTISIMFLWAPSDNSKDYAYYEQGANVDGDDGNSAGIEMTQTDNMLQPAFSIDDEGDEPVYDKENAKSHVAAADSL